MDGANLAAERQHNRNISLAWHTAAFMGLAWNGKLEGLAAYTNVPDAPPQEPWSPEQLLSAFQEMHANGAPMTIRQVH